MTLASALQYVWQITVLDLRNRYAGSVLGPLWLFLPPVVQIAIYSLIFTNLMTARIAASDGTATSFTLYLCAGIMPWAVFATLAARSASLLRAASAYILNAAVPEEVFFLRTALEALLIAMFSLLLVLAAALVLGEPYPRAWLALPPIVVLFVLFALGVGMVIGVTGTFVRDVEPGIDLVLRVWFWATPIVYAPSILPTALRELLWLNPAYLYIGAIQASVLRGRAPDPETWTAMTLAATVAVLVGWTLVVALRSQLRDAL